MSLKDFFPLLLSFEISDRRFHCIGPTSLGTGPAFVPLCRLRMGYTEVVTQFYAKVERFSCCNNLKMMFQEASESCTVLTHSAIILKWEFVSE